MLGANQSAGRRLADMFVYILQSETNGHFYIGATEDVADRVARHNANSVLATRRKGPWRLVYFEKCAGRDEAFRRERQLDRKSVV